MADEEPPLRLLPPVDPEPPCDHASYKRFGQDRRSVRGWIADQGCLWVVLVSIAIWAIIVYALLKGVFHVI